MSGDRPVTSYLFDAADDQSRNALIAHLHAYLGIACAALDEASDLAYELGWPGTGSDLTRLLAQTETLRDTTQLPG